jgi:RimJ/RimL family protein N-acetyltransferase
VSESLETERLILRKWNLGDFDSYASMTAEPEVMRFLSPRRPLSRYEAWGSLTAMVGHWQLRGFGMFAVVERASNQLVGRVGPWQPEGWPDFEVGWTLRRQYWGRGFATEAVKACIRFAFTTLDRSHLISIIDPENVKSAGVAERVGEQLEGNVRIPSMPDKQFLQYGLYRSRWSNSSG